MYSLNKIEGVIETVGQSEFDLTGQLYAYIRIKDKSGNIVMLKNVLVPNTVGSYVKSGCTGTFYYLLDKKVAIFFAYSNSERKVFDSDDAKAFRKAFRWQGVIHFGYLLVSVLMMFMLIGFITTPFIAYATYKLLVKFPSVFSDSNLKAYLSQHGFVFA